MIILLWLLACEPEPSISPARWAPVSPPPGHEDVECFVWSDANGGMDASYGGPACFPKVAK